ncbi:type IV toxin-antitoxin system AbiEi family antitoxin domain-containing protein [Arthrobacter sp. H5]|uniref:type IV toxin-antitoxin system AbiEi family antitoxin domain-containing protein n=1 Tax=Arthrobacter sp. H5 TaxID=1267973 RepID=UPI0004854501|nr:type IV toxin-antitoxin system AbiEi family antitoxin domain-containing protein [Arthrobacter sp. H5]
MSFERVLLDLGGVARRKDLVSAGIGRAEIKGAIDRGEVVKPSRGVFAVPNPTPELLAAKCVKAELACISAAKHLELWILRQPSLIHVRVNHGRALEGNFRVHRAGPGGVSQMCQQVMRCLPELDALCIVESAVVRGLVTLRELQEAVTGQRDGPARRIVALVDPHSQSIIETVARYHLHRTGFSCQSQVYVQGVGRLDLFVEGILGIEADGREYYSGRQEFEEDRRRWNLLTVGAIPLIRATQPLLVNQPTQFIDWVTRVLARKPAHRVGHPSGHN